MLNSSKSMMNYQYQLNKQLADQNRNWQERMANSAHQREIADLKKAGLNPVLTLTGGQGATTPTGSTASVGDGSGYASALANLEAARLNSAATLGAAMYHYDASVYTADKNQENVIYQTENPSATTIPSTIAWALTQAGKKLDNANKRHNYILDSNRTRRSINQSNNGIKVHRRNKSAHRHRAQTTMNSARSYSSWEAMMKDIIK